MKLWPTNPMHQNNKLISAVCDDLFDRFANKTEGTPRADRVVEIARQHRAVKS